MRLSGLTFLIVSIIMPGSALYKILILFKVFNESTVIFVFVAGMTNKVTQYRTSQALSTIKVQPINQL